MGGHGLKRTLGTTSTPLLHTHARVISNMFCVSWSELSRDTKVLYVPMPRCHTAAIIASKRDKELRGITIVSLSQTKLFESAFGICIRFILYCFFTIEILCSVRKYANSFHTYNATMHTNSPLQTNRHTEFCIDFIAAVRTCSHM